MFSEPTSKGYFGMDQRSQSPGSNPYQGLRSRSKSPNANTNNSLFGSQSRERSKSPKDSSSLFQRDRSKSPKRSGFRSKSPNMMDELSKNPLFNRSQSPIDNPTPVERSLPIRRDRTPDRTSSEKSPTISSILKEKSPVMSKRKTPPPPARKTSSPGRSLIPKRTSSVTAEDSKKSFSSGSTRWAIGSKPFSYMYTSRAYCWFLMWTL